ncbi:MAG: dapF, partial [Gammaproteobacteria bacterium]|nr:dapF [Gammaproteobacteria bacterium]
IQQLPALKAVGMACHIGSQILELSPFAEALSCVLQLVTALKEHNIILHHVDVGGGLGVCYDAEIPPSLEEYAATLLSTLQEQAPYPLELWLEPGRVLVANAAILVAKVEYLKETANKTFAILDAGMTDLVRPALYDAHHKIIAVKQLAQKEIKVDLVGPVCESSDFLGKSRLLAINPGDLIAVRSVGAYGFSMGSHYNARPRSAEVLVYKDKTELIRRRETIADLLSHEQKQPFLKMQALGNDFVLLDLDENPEVWSSEKIKRLSHRQMGIGFDQLLTIKRKKDNAFYYKIYNADGGEVEQCGNGARAVALYLTLKNKIERNRDIQLLTCNRFMAVKSVGTKRFIVDMGKPDFSPAAIPLQMPLQDHYELVVENETHRFAALSMGNPHAVLEVVDVNEAPVQTVGKALCSHPCFPRQSNVGFMQIINKHRLALRVYERGVGETLACGSGACAAAVIAIRNGDCQSPVTVQLTGGELIIHWQGKNESVWMEGHAQCVYEGMV